MTNKFKHFTSEAIGWGFIGIFIYSTCSYDYRRKVEKKYNEVSYALSLYRNSTEMIEVDPRYFNLHW